MLRYFIGLAVACGGCSTNEQQPSNRTTDGKASVEFSDDGSDTEDEKTKPEKKDGSDAKEKDKKIDQLAPSISSFKITAPSTPLSRESLVSWEQASGAAQYTVSLTPTSNCQEPVWTKQTAENSLLLSEAPAGTHFLCVQAFKDQLQKSAENNGVAVVIKSGWERVTNPGLTPRIGGAAVWTGKEVLIWGGATSTQSNQPDAGTTLTYAEAWDPATGTIRKLPFPPEVTPTRYASLVWTGTYALIWGGGTGIGPAYGSRPIERGYKWDPGANTYEVLPTENGPGPSRHHPAAWTGSEMLIYGSNPDVNGLAAAVIKFRAYNPVTGKWRDLPADKYTGYNNGIWTGDQLLMPELGLAYSPATNTYTQRSKTNWFNSILATYVWTGKKVIYWGGGVGGVTDEGRFYEPTLDKWTSMPKSGEVPSARWLHQAVWVDNRMYVFGGAATGTGSSPDLFVYWP